MYKTYSRLYFIFYSYSILNIGILKTSLLTKNFSIVNTAPLKLIPTCWSNISSGVCPMGVPKNTPAFTNRISTTRDHRSDLVLQKKDRKITGVCCGRRRQESVISHGNETMGTSINKPQYNSNKVRAQEWTVTNNTTTMGTSINKPQQIKVHQVWWQW